MSISELGSLGEFIGSIAVLVTLGYLIVQLRQNTRAIRSQSRFQVLETLNADWKLNIDPEFAQVSSKAYSANATDEDRVRLSWYWVSMMNHLEILHWEIADHVLPDTFESTLRFRLKSLFLFEDAKRIWSANTKMFTHEFIQYVEMHNKQFDDLNDGSLDENNPHDYIARLLLRKQNTSPD